MEQMTEISQDEMVYAVIYKYTNKLNGKTYVGQTINEDQRMKDHLKAARLEGNSQHHTPFHRALNKYGLENFDYEVIFRVRCPKEVAKDMAIKLKMITGRDICISTTGNAGPTVCDDKPVGRVYVGINYLDDMNVYTLDIIGDREKVRIETASFVFDKLDKLL